MDSTVCPPGAPRESMGNSSPRHLEFKPTMACGEIGIWPYNMALGILASLRTLTSIVGKPWV